MTRDSENVGTKPLISSRHLRGNITLPLSQPLHSSTSGLVSATKVVKGFRELTSNGGSEEPSASQRAT